MQVKFWTFSKEVNSTARPSPTSSPVVIEGKIRDTCTVESPIIGFTAAAVADFSRYNYANIPDFGNRYYYVDNWEWVEGRWFAYFRNDPLATYRAEILNSTQYVVRSSINYRNSGFIDTAYPVTSVATTHTVPFAAYLEEPCYVVGVIGGGNYLWQEEEAVKTGVVKYIFLKPEQFEKFSTALTGSLLDSVSDSISEISSDLLKVLFDPLSYVISCKYFPVSPDLDNSDFYYESPSINIGPWTMQCDCHIARSENSVLYNIISKAIDLPDHPQADERGWYLRSEPYSSYYLTFKPFAVDVALPSGVCQHERRIYVSVLFDFRTGDGFLDVNCFNQDVEQYSCMSIPGKFGIDIPLAQITSNVYQAGAIIAKDVLRLANPANWDDIARDGLINVGDALNAAKPSVSITSSVTSLINFESIPFIKCVFHPIADEDIDHVGRLYLGRNILRTFNGGFIRCSDAHFDVNAPTSTAAEREVIVNHLNGGLYLK